ncbi:type IV secretory system conjugative DNA transfer family protein [Candidatus Parcubacteria bacterium]|nr:type IV secretory system conjugative DNA transfer family protein [Candidatus Parcubacteria bacterium]
MALEEHFNSPQEELAHLREKVLEAERKLLRHGVEKPRDSVIRESIKTFEEAHLGNIREEKKRSAEEQAAHLMRKHVETQLEEMMQITADKGVLSALATAESMKDWKLEDDFHDFLVGVVSKGLPPRGVKEKGPIFKALHMSLYEVMLPKKEGERDRPLTELIKSMEQVYSGLMSIESHESSEAGHMAFEIANPEGEEDTHVFVSVPTDKRDLFERQVLSIFPEVKLIPRERDYNMFNEMGVTLGSSASLTQYGYSLKTSDAFSDDPLNVILNGFSKIPLKGAGAALQIIFKPAGEKYMKHLSEALKDISKGVKPKEALKISSVAGEFGETLGQVLFGVKEKKPEVVDPLVVQSIQRKMESPIVETNIRLAVSCGGQAEARHVLENLQSSFNQFEEPGKNKFEWNVVKVPHESDFYRAFTFRLFRDSEVVPLNLRELSTILHLRGEALNTSSLKRSTTKSAAPQTIARSGLSIGVNNFQGRETKIFLSDEDRLRHFYVIGQTGTGKSTLLKNMIIEDIQRGEGVCMIDPHGQDLMDVMSNIPNDRFDDVIYFDPASTDKPMGLNMLEYDHNKPEQKTFVVNELFSIFQKLYGKVPESMGPMFEQYFRNATQLVIEDPDTGSTLLDVSRVLSNKEYRNLKLSRCQNPIIVQFWREVAEKAGGEAALANIVPYITSKFDVFLSNDIMRPIIAQEHSTFNFREIMDSKKILLVNLSKGRLGEVNANLLGLIIVGKILLAALSRAYSFGSEMPPFYLYIDEFQNITTNSISTILSEARKYKLALTVAHQFIAQLDPDIKNAVFGNVGSICAFRVGADDAKYLETQFAPAFTADDLMNIDNRHAHMKILVNGRPTSSFDMETLPPPQGVRDSVTTIMNLSKGKYGRDRKDVEHEILEKYQPALAGKKKEPTMMSAPGLGSRS